MSKKKETIFDHNLTEEEFKYFFRKVDLENQRIVTYTKEEAMEKVKNMSQDENYAYLAHLYMLRRNKKKMEEYLDKIKDDILRAETGHILYNEYYTRQSLGVWSDNKE